MQLVCSNKSRCLDGQAPISNPEHMEASLSNNQPNCPTECGDSVPVFEAENSNSNLSLSREQLIKDQEMDAEISCLAESAFSEEEAADNPKC